MRTNPHKKTTRNSKQKQQRGRLPICAVVLNFGQLLKGFAGASGPAFFWPGFFVDFFLRLFFYFFSIEKAFFGQWIIEKAFFWSMDHRKSVFFGQRIIKKMFFSKIVFSQTGKMKKAERL